MKRTLHEQKEKKDFIFLKIFTPLGWILLIPVYFYKYVISPFTPASCRYIPSCSEYTVQAIKIHGPLKGFRLAAKRILKCHPWGNHGYDPVPQKSGVNEKS